HCKASFFSEHTIASGNHKPHICVVVPPGNTDPNGQQGETRKEMEKESATDMLRKSNEELELLLAFFGEQTTQAVILENLILKEFTKLSSESMVVYWLKIISKLSLNLRSEKGSTLPTFALKNVRGANTASFRRHCEAMVKMHKPVMLLLLETRMGEHKRLTELQKCLDHCNMVDLGYRGRKYSLTNKRYKNKTHFILERLDRCVANTSWIIRYPNDIVNHLSRTKFDHYPLQVRLENPQGTIQNKPFRMEPM
ncbi:hypothetical protein H5410_046224, partial [Solanum commersonii]